MQAREKERERKKEMTHDRTFHLIPKKRKNFIERRISAETNETFDIWRKVGESGGGVGGR